MRRASILSSCGQNDVYGAKKVKTKRVQLAKITMKDVPRVHELSLDEQNRKFLADEVFETEIQAKEVVKQLVQNHRTGASPLVWSVRLNGLHIGHVELVKIQNGFEVGYFIGEEFRGNGYAFRALKLFLQRLKATTDLKEVYGICHLQNVASRKVLLKCGFTFEKTEREKMVFIYRFNQL